MNKRTPIFLGILLVALALWALLTSNPSIRHTLNRLDDLVYDIGLRTRVLTTHRKPFAPIVIVDIDDHSLQVEGRWPWSRAKLAALTDALRTLGAGEVVFDVLFPEAENNIVDTLMQNLTQKKWLTSEVQSVLEKSRPEFDNDALFAKSLTQIPAILALSLEPRKHIQGLLPKPLLTLTPAQTKEFSIYRAVGYISNIPLLENAAQNAGFLNIFADIDGIYRRAPLLMIYNNNVYGSLALEAVQIYLGEPITLFTPAYGKQNRLEGVQIGNQIIPTDEKGQVIIPFVGRSYSFPYYSATDILHGHIPRQAIDGKLVFIGTSATGLGDLKPAAIQNPFPGVEIQATIANGIIENSFSRNPAWTLGANLLLCLILGLLCTVIFPFFGPRILGLLIVLIPPGMLFANNLFWEYTGYILSVLIPTLLLLALALLNIIYGYLFETLKRERLKDMFGQYVPEKHIDEMMRSQGDYGLYGEDREMTVLFADIRSFTTLSEGMSASQLKDMLDAFFTPMTEIIFSHRGTIDKYVGDMIMAFWGAPLKDKNHARHAVTAALEMQHKVKELQASFKERQWPTIHIGIGLNSGVMSVGDMGSHYRRNYTVLGDEVNLGSRVEGLTKFYGVDIIVTEHTQQNQPKIVFRQLDRVRVKGKQQSINIYEAICLHSKLTDVLTEELKLYEKALQMYFQQQWQAASDVFQQLHELYPGKRLYNLYLERIDYFKSSLPPADWDGVFTHTEK